MTTTKEIRTREFHENELQAIRNRASADAERRREYDDDRALSAWAEGASIDFHQFALKLIADGMTATFPALYEGDRFVVADLIKTDFGLCWRLADVEADLIKRRGKRFIPWAKGSTSRIQKTLGLHECRARFPVEAEVESRCAFVGSVVTFVPVKASVQPLSKEVQE